MKSHVNCPLMLVSFEKAYDQKRWTKLMAMLRLDSHENVRISLSPTCSYGYGPTIFFILGAMPPQEYCLSSRKATIFLSPAPRKDKLSVSRLRWMRDKEYAFT